MNRTLVGLALTMLLAQWGTSSANVALPLLSQVFLRTPGDTQAVVSVYLLALTVFSVLAGPVGDRWGRRRVLMAGVGLFTLASALAAGAPTLEWLLVCRGLQGLGAAAMVVFAIALVGDVVPREQMGRAMGLLGTTNAVGTALGPSVGGLLLGAWGWEALFVVLVPLGLLALGLLWGGGFEPQPANGGRLGFLPKGALRGRMVGVVQNALAMAVLMATLVVGPFYLSGTFALQPAALGLVMTVGPLVAALTGVPSGYAVDRWGASRVVPIGLLGMALASLALALVPAAWGVFGYGAALAFLTASYSVFQTANNTAVMEGVADAHRGSTSAVLSLSRNLGLLLGTVGLGGLFAWLGSPLSAAFSWTFGVGVLVLTVALVLGAVRGVARLG